MAAELKIRLETDLKMLETALKQATVDCDAVHAELRRKLTRGDLTTDEYVAVLKSVREIGDRLLATARAIWASSSDTPQ
jgi:hypothetical protein